MTTTMTDERYQEIMRAAVDWQYLVVLSGEMAVKSDLEAWLMGRYGIDHFTARGITNDLTDGPCYFIIGDHGVEWQHLTAGRPAPTHGLGREDILEYILVKRFRVESSAAQDIARSLTDLHGNAIARCLTDLDGDVVVRITARIEQEKLQEMAATRDLNKRQADMEGNAPKAVLKAIEAGYPLYWRVREGTPKYYSYHLYAETYSWESGKVRNRQLVMYVSRQHAEKLDRRLVEQGLIKPEYTLQAAIHNYEWRE